MDHRPSTMDSIDIDFSIYKEFLSIKKEGDKHYIFDPIRKKYLILQPEELVRQLVLEYLIREKGYSKNRIQVERLFTVNTRRKRCDILIFDEDTQPYLLVECKSAKIDITQATFDQIAQYNLELNVPYLLLTNGLTTYCCRMNHEAETYDFLEEVPGIHSH